MTEDPRKLTTRSLLQAALVAALLVDFCVMLLLVGCSPYMPATAAPSQEPTTTATTAATQRAISTLTTTPYPSCQVVTGIEAGRVNLRSGPGTSNAAIGLLREGEAVTVIERGAWLKVETSQRVTGWVNSKFCK